MDSRFRTTGKFRNICFTLNNYTEEEYSFFHNLVTENSARARAKVKYIVFQKETGEEGTQHLQGYIELEKRIRHTSIKRLINRRMHFERRRGTQQEAIDYCKKEDSRMQNTVPEEGGSRRVQGARKSSVKELAQEMKKGMDLDSVQEEYPGLFLLHRNKILDYHLEIKGFRNWAMDIQIFVGKTGSGKSYTSHSENCEAYSVPWPSGGRWWWPGYTGQDCVIMDEFRHQIKYDVMLKMMDRYEWVLESKGRNFQFCSRRIVITTNIDPKDWYPGLSKDKKEPLRRRIQEFAKIYDFRDGCSYPDFVKTLRTEEFEFNAGGEDIVRAIWRQPTNNVNTHYDS